MGVEGGCVQRMEVIVKMKKVGGRVYVYIEWKLL